MIDSTPASDCSTPQKIDHRYHPRVDSRLAAAGVLRHQLRAVAVGKAQLKPAIPMVCGSRCCVLAGCSADKKVRGRYGLRCDPLPRPHAPMLSHPNARLTQKSRLRLGNQHLQDYRPLDELAAKAAISLRCGYKWLARFRKGGHRFIGNRQ